MNHIWITKGPPEVSKEEGASGLVFELPKSNSVGFQLVWIEKKSFLCRGGMKEHHKNVPSDRIKKY